MFFNDMRITKKKRFHVSGGVGQSSLQARAFIWNLFFKCYNNSINIDLEAKIFDLNLEMISHDKPLNIITSQYK